MVFTKLYAREHVDFTRRNRPGVSVELFAKKGESPLGGLSVVLSMLEVASALSSTVSYLNQTPQHIQYIKC
jgi:hypothetical protein